MEAGDLDQGLRRSDPDRWLTTRFITDPAARADVMALYAYDSELTRARQVASNALMTEIRLTWWREVLDQIYAAAPVRQHPVAQALAGVVRRHGLQREPLESMIDARIDALEKPALQDNEATAWARGVGGSAAQLAARMLGAERPQDAAGAGEIWGLVLLRRAGMISGGALVRDAIRSAGTDARHLNVTAFPAALPATLARASDGASDLEKRARLIWSALRGRI